jgi:hypothetical protein
VGGFLSVYLESIMGNFMYITKKEFTFALKDGHKVVVRPQGAGFRVRVLEAVHGKVRPQSILSVTVPVLEQYTGNKEQFYNALITALQGTDYIAEGAIDVRVKTLE